MNEDTTITWFVSKRLIFFVGWVCSVILALFFRVLIKVLIKIIKKVNQSRINSKLKIVKELRAGVDHSMVVDYEKIEECSQSFNMFRVKYTQLEKIISKMLGLKKNDNLVFITRPVLLAASRNLIKKAVELILGELNKLTILSAVENKTVFKFYVLCATSLLSESARPWIQDPIVKIMIERLKIGQNSKRVHLIKVVSFLLYHLAQLTIFSYLSEIFFLNVVEDACKDFLPPLKKYTHSDSDNPELNGKPIVPENWFEESKVIIVDNLNPAYCNEEKESQFLKPVIEEKCFPTKKGEVCHVEREYVPLSKRTKTLADLKALDDSQTIQNLEETCQPRPNRIKVPLKKQPDREL
jgi:hypothetical protein